MRKILSILIAVSLILASASPGFAADSAGGNGLEKAILQVKSITAIPSDYKDFQYSSSTSTDNGTNVSVWYLNWNNADYSGGISAACVDGGYLISFNKYNNSQKEGLGTISREAGQKTAAGFLAKVRPDAASDLKLMDHNDYSGSDRYVYQYKMYKNGAMVDYVDASVEVDKFTGEVVGYSFSGDSQQIKDLPGTDGVIGLKEAQKAYLEKIKIKLSYYSYYDYNKRTLKIFPAYTGANTEGKAIDAKTGEAVELYNNYSYFGDKGGSGNMNQASETASSTGNLTKEELEAVTGLSGLIKKDKAAGILRGAIPGMASGAKVISTSLSRNYYEQDKYQWEIGFDGAYGVVNAKTGAVMSFYVFNEDAGKTGITEEKAREKADAFLKMMEPEKFAQSRFYENPQIRIYKTSEDISEYSFNYYRQVNGIDFIGNGFTVIVNKASGKVTQYDCSWFDNMTFPSITNVMAPEKAFDLVNETGKMDLMYGKITEDQVALVYDFTYPTNDFLIDPVNGQRIGWDGEPYKIKDLPVYTDIKGHWAEGKILKLLENGYYLDGEKFNPNQKITQMNFLRYLYSPIQTYYDDEEFYKLMVTDKIIKDGEKSPTAALTRQDAAKFVVRYLGQGKSAEHPEIFVNPYTDKISDVYKGYAAICYGLKVMQGDKNGRFNGMNQVSNAEAAAIIYNVLQVQ